MCEHLNNKRYGTTANNKQRYQCFDCGKTFIRNKSVNRLPEPLVNKVVKALKSGKSHRAIEAALGVNRGTVQRYSKVIGIKYKYRPALRPKRRDYLKDYWRAQSMTQWQKLQWRERCRASISLWLAKNKKALTAQQIYSAIKPQYPDLSMNSLLQFLNVNSEECYKKVRGNKWTYRPQEWFVPHELQTCHFPERELARRMYYQVRGIRDANLEMMQKCWDSDRKSKEQEQLRKAIKKSTPSLVMLATATAIAKTYESYN